MHLQTANPQPDSAPIVVWELTRACRLNCIHCAVGAQQRRNPLELSTYEAYKTIDQIVSLRPQEVIFTGGDILERADLYQLVDYARRRGMRPTVTLTTTPSLTGAVIGKLKHNGADRVVLGVDSSTPERHDGVRGLPGQFSSALLAMRWARTAGIPLEVNTLVGRKSLTDLATIAHLIGDIGIERWNVYFLVPTGQSKHVEMLTAEEIEQAFAQLWEISQKAPFAVRTFEAPQYRRYVFEQSAKENRDSRDRFFAAPEEALVAREVRTAGVSADELIFVSHTGEVSVSPFVPLTAGNVRYQPLSIISRTAELFAALRDTANLKGKCGRCEFRSICGGSRARAFAMSGDLFASDPLCGYQPGAFAPEAASLVPADA